MGMQSISNLSSWQLDSAGWVNGVAWQPSPNFNQRSDPRSVTLLVIHCISLPPGQYGGNDIIRFFQNRLVPSRHPFYQTIAELKVSAHFLIRRNGYVVQLVSVYDRAWHAGQSCFKGYTDCNDFSIGIELEGTDTDCYTASQYQALVSLTRLLQHHFPALQGERITGHADIAPGRKTDPGEAFDWRYYRDALE